MSHKRNSENSKSLNLVMLVLGNEYGGQPVSTLNLIRGLPEHGINVTVISCCESQFYERIIENRIEVISLGLPKPPLTYVRKEEKWKPRSISFHLILVIWWILKATFRFFKVCRKMKIDVIHCAYAHPAIIAGIVAKIARVPLVCHQRYAHSTRTTFWLERVATNFVVTRFAAISHYIKRTMPESWAHKVTVVHNGVEDIEPAEDKEFLRKKANASKDKFLVGMAGTILPHKGWDDFVKLANLSNTRRMEGLCFLAMGGKGREDSYEYYNGLVNACIEESAKFLGTIPLVNRYFRELSIFVFMTRKPGEPFGLVIAEAMLAEVPVVTYNSGAVTEIVEDGETGIVVEDGDVEGMLDAIRKLIDNLELRKQMGQRGRQVVLDKFSMDKAVTKMAELLRQIVQK